MMLRHLWGRTSLTWLLCWTSTKQGHFEPLSWHCQVGRRWNVTAGVHYDGGIYTQCPLQDMRPHSSPDELPRAEGLLGTAAKAMADRVR